VERFIGKFYRNLFRYGGDRIPSRIMGQPTRNQSDTTTTMKNTIEQLEHRLAMVEDDIAQLRKFIYAKGLDETFQKPTDVGDEAWTILNNIEIACDLTSDECLTWRVYNHPAEQVIRDLKAMDVDGETMQYILEQVGMSDQILKQLIVSSKTQELTSLLELKYILNHKCK